MFSKFLPREFNFFDMFEKQAHYAVDAADLFKELVSSGAIDESALQRMRDIEHLCDDAAHTIIDQLNKTFITPFDREDIHELTKELDDIVDMFNTIIGRLSVYKINEVNKNLVDFSLVIEESVRAVECAIKGMRNMKNLKAISDFCVEINRLENVGDSMRDKVLGELFETQKDPIAVIKWKEIYQEAETVLDICEDVAHMVESILVRQA